MKRQPQRFGQRHKTVPTSSGLPWVFTDKAVTAWGGLRLMQAFLMRLHFREMLASSLLPQPLSNRGYSPEIMLESFLVAVWVGGVRFAHNGCIELLTQALTLLPPGHRVAFVPADTGVFVTTFLTFSGAPELPYIIIARLPPPLYGGWCSIADRRAPDDASARGWLWPECLAALPCWQGQSRRLVCVRQAWRERHHAAGRRLLDCPG